jgi:hypothetical protein
MSPSSHHLPVISWQNRLDAAVNEAEIIDCARDFIAQFDPYEVNALPAPCRPPAKIVDAEDIAAYAFELVRHDCDEGAAETQLVFKLAHFFAHAATRISQVNAFHPAADALEEERKLAQ